MTKVVVSFAAALMLGGASVALAQQMKDGADGRQGGPAVQGRSAPDGAGGRGAASGRDAGQAQPNRESGRDAGRGAERAQKGEPAQRQPSRDGDADRRQAQDKQPAPTRREAQDQKQNDRANREAQDQKQQRDRANREAQDQKQQRDRANREAQDQKQQRDRANREAQDQKQQQDRANREARDQKQQRDRQAQDKRAPSESAAKGAGDRDGRNAERVEWNQEQKVRVREQFRRERANLRHHTNVNIDIRIGNRLPRHWTYRPVPRFVVDLAPRFRGYRYVWVENRYVIVEPRTYEVVAYIDDSSGEVYAYSDAVGSSSTGKGGGEGGRGSASCDVTFSDDQERRIVAALDDVRPAPLPELRVGINLPGDVELRVFPTQLRSEFVRLDGCRYVPISADTIAIVEPDTRRVVAIVAR